MLSCNAKLEFADLARFIAIFFSILGVKLAFTIQHLSSCTLSITEPELAASFKVEASLIVFAMIQINFGVVYRHDLKVERRYLR